MISFTEVPLSPRGQSLCAPRGAGTKFSFWKVLELQAPSWLIFKKN